ncbi:MAG: hypothetical protein NZ519_01325 [Bacteroidia bacterium]|nr:hypothetical protein [Bacteroidia bacterium]MDW8301355.1 hypothetical protein [Bacteroidia bacterium]
MHTFNIGDKVALIHEKSAGVITNIQDNLITVHIQDMDMEIEIDAKLIMLVEKAPAPQKESQKDQTNLQISENQEIAEKIKILKQAGIGYQAKEIKTTKDKPKLATEIDLHWEVLQKSNPIYAKIPNDDVDEIFRIQRLEFENFFLRALQYNLNSISIIHGIGSGKLKEYIHAYIKRHEKNVDSYQVTNDGGLTQVIFKAE